MMNIGGSNPIKLTNNMADNEGLKWSPRWGADYLFIAS